MQNILFNIITISFFVFIGLLYATADPTTAAKLTGENDVIENLQLLFLAIGLSLAIYGYFRHKLPAFKYILLGFVLLIIAFILREMEFRGTQAPEFLIYISSPKGALLITVLIFAPYILYSLKNFKCAWASAFAFTKTIHFVRMSLAASLLIIGGVFDRELIDTVYSQFFEEFFELGGYYVLAWALFKMLPQQISRDFKVYRHPENRCINLPLMQRCTL